MIIGDISFSIQGNYLFLSVLLLAGIGLAMLFYRYTLPPLPPARRIVLSSLRALTLCLLLLLFFEPVLRFINKNDQPPTVAVLIDNSQSMTLRDSTGERGEAVRSYLKTEPFKSITSPARVMTYAFSSTLPQATLESADALKFTGETTNLSEAVAQLRKRMITDNIQSVVFVTDGNFTVGKNPLYEAEALGIPVYTVGVGDTVEKKDILVANVVTNTIAYAETKVPVDVTVKSSGYGGENVEVVLKEGTNVLDRKVLTLENGTREYQTHLTFEPKAEGMMKYTVSVSDLQGELTGKNNSQTVFVKVLKSKLHILILAGAPNPDIAAIRQALVEDEHFAVQARIQNKEQGFYEGTVTRQLMDSTDCFVLVGFPSAATPLNVVQELKNAIETGKKPVLFVNAKTTNYQKLAQLEPLLPFTWQIGSATEMLVFATVPERQKANTLIRLDGTITPETWHAMPPIFKMQTIFQLKPESDMLAAVRVQNIDMPEPLVTTRNVNKMKSFAITGYGIWRWHLLADEENEQNGFLSMLLTNAVRWLTTKEEGKNVHVTPTKDMFTTSEPIEFTGQVYDNQFRPVDDAEVTVTIQRTGEAKEIALNAAGNGLFEGASESLGEGDYTYIAKAIVDGRTLGEDKGKFTVGLMNVEFIETKLNKPLLEQLAYRTNGKYYHISSAQRLADDMKADVQFASKEVIQSSEIELWNWYYLAGLIILLLAVEWFLRKQSGMI